MDKKVASAVRNHEDFIGRYAKVHESPVNPHDYLSNHEGDTIDVHKHQHLVDQLFFTAKLEPKLGNATRELSGLLASPGTTHR